MPRNQPAETRDHSLPEVHESVGTTHANFWKRLLAFAGPAYLVSVGYMDPGNWATDLEGGAKFGYRLLWVSGAFKSDGAAAADAEFAPGNCEPPRFGASLPRRISAGRFFRSLAAVRVCHCGL